MGGLLGGMAPRGLHTCMLSCAQLFTTPWTVAHQAPLPMGFSRQKSTGVDCHVLLLGSSNSGIGPASPVLAGGFFTTVPLKGWDHFFLHVTVTLSFCYSGEVTLMRCTIY